MGKEIYVLPHRINESLGTNELIKEGSAKVIYDIDQFIEEFTKTTLQKENSDDFLEFCKTNPTFDEALLKYDSLVYEYELDGQIQIKNGFINLC